MYGVNHAVLGAAGGFLAGTYLEAPFTTRCIMGTFGAFGGLISDADTKSSILGRHLPDFWHKLTPGHRKFTHSLPYCALVLALALLVQWWGQIGDPWNTLEFPYYPIALATGVMTHLFADSLTVQGVPLFYPFAKKFRFKPLGPLSFRTGSEVEPAVVTILLSIGVAYALMPFTDGIADMFVAPTILGIQTESLIVFMASAVVSAVVLTLYSLSKKTNFKRRRSKSRRR